MVDFFRLECQTPEIPQKPEKNVEADEIIQNDLHMLMHPNVYSLDRIKKIHFYVMYNLYKNLEAFRIVVFCSI